MAAVWVAALLWAHAASAQPINYCNGCYDIMPAWYCRMSGC
jgi:hypothetical protein